MKVFISWSGERSRAVALALRGWLPDVIQSIVPWMSAEDIDAGTRWGSNVTTELSETRFGIICLTRDNQTAPWILFEAGALAKTIENTYVCPYLFDLEPADIQHGPLTQFQAKRAVKPETFELIRTINRAHGNVIADDSLQRAFDLWWPQLENSLKQVPVHQDRQKAGRSSEDMLREILESVRQLVRSSSNIRDFEEQRLSDIFSDIARIKQSPAEVQRLKAAVNGILHILSPTVQGVVKLRFGLNDEVPHSYEEIAKILGISLKEVRELEAVALRAFRYSYTSSHTP